MAQPGRLILPTLARFSRIDGAPRAAVPIRVDGQSVEALEGDTVLTALVAATGAVRAGEFGEGPRGGFCCVGACQDCWVATRDGRRLRACTTQVAPWMDIVTGLHGHE